MPSAIHPTRSLLITFPAQLRPSLSGQFVESPAGAGQGRNTARVFLPATYDHIDINRIDFHDARLAPGSFAGNQRRARTTEQIEDQVAFRAAVADRALDQFDWFHGRVEIIYDGLLDRPYIALGTISAPEMARAFTPAVKNWLVLR